MSSDPTCPFCDIVRGVGPAHIVYEDEHSMAFLDIAPAVEGHTLVIPRTHARTLLDIAPASAATLMSCAVQVARLIDRAFHPDGMTMVQANERAGGQTVFHVHLHLVPRWNGDPLFRPWNATPAAAELLKATQAKMVAAGPG